MLPHKAGTLFMCVSGGVVGKHQFQGILRSDRSLYLKGGVFFLSNIKEETCLAVHSGQHEMKFGKLRG